MIRTKGSLSMEGRLIKSAVMMIAGALVLTQCQCSGFMPPPCKSVPSGVVGMQNFSEGLALVRDEKEYIGVRLSPSIT
jgi:hypothetical protein